MAATAYVTLDEHPAQRDILAAQRAVIVHAPEDWPSGRMCRNCGYLSRFPCRLHVWGFRLLLSAGWTPTGIAELVRRAERGEVPWSS